MLQRETSRAQPPVKGVQSPTANELFGASADGELGGESLDDRLELKRAVISRLQDSGHADHAGDNSLRSLRTAPEAALVQRRVSKRRPCDASMTVMLYGWTKS